MKLEPIFILCGWSIIISSILLQALYVGPMLSWLHWILLLLASILSGIVLVDLRIIVLGYFPVLALSLLITFFCLAGLPVITGAVLFDVFTDILSVSIVLVMQSTFPGVWIMCLLAGIFGGGIGERLRTLAPLSKSRV